MTLKFKFEVKLTPYFKLILTQFTNMGFEFVIGNLNWIKEAKEYLFIPFYTFINNFNLILQPLL